MNIGGFGKNSLIDFPGTIACIVFTRGCNFFCPYCHNPDLVTGPGTRSAAGNLSEPDNLIEPEWIFDFLDKRKGLLQGVVITGGEPCLQKDLPQFCLKIKQMGYKVKLDTNGSFPRVVEHLLKQELLDFVAMDIKTSLENYSLVAPDNFDARKIADSVKIIMNNAPDYEFRTTCSRPFINAEILENIGRMVSGASRYSLAKCSRNVKVLDSNFVKSDNHFYSDGEMENLKKILDPYVVKTILR